MFALAGLGLGMAIFTCALWLLIVSVGTEFGPLSELGPLLLNSSHLFEPSYSTELVPLRLSVSTELAPL